MPDHDHQADARQRRIEDLAAQVERLRVVAAAANRASQQIDAEIRTLEPQVNNMQEAAVALSTLVNLTGSIQRELVGALNQLAPGDVTDSPPSASD